MIQQHKTYTSDARWREGIDGSRQLYARVREYTIWRCSKCGIYFWQQQKAKEHKHET